MSLCPITNVTSRFTERTADIYLDMKMKQYLVRFYNDAGRYMGREHDYYTVSLPAASGAARSFVGLK